MGIHMRGKRLNGGSSPKKEQHYKAHAVIAEKHKMDALERRVRKMNKRAEKKNLSYRYKLNEVEIKGKTIHNIIKVKK